MKKVIILFFACFWAIFAYANSIFYDSFEYVNHDLEVPNGWTSDDQSWLCGYLEKDHNRMAHSGNWYVFTNADDSWMFIDLFLSKQFKYRLSCWTISDGAFTLEFWAGSGANTGQMTQQLYSIEVNNENYHKVSAYVETLFNDFQYIGIHAVAAEGAYHLTIDDVNIDMVDKYDMEIDPYTADTVMFPGTQFTHNFRIQNTGYQDFGVIVNTHSDYFTDIHFTADGESCTSFPFAANQIVNCTCTGTLLPTIEPGTTCWIDIVLAADCDCITRMTTLWVTPMFLSVNENNVEVGVYPNPASNFVKIQSEMLQKVEIIDISGKEVISVKAENDNIDLDISHLKSGTYILKAITAKGIKAQEFIKE